MIPISKKVEPRELLGYRKQKYSSYADMPKDVRLAVLGRLVEEQGWLCAYCMSRLPKDEKGRAVEGRVTIEHWSPQRPTGGGEPHDALDYRNMLAVCLGNRGAGAKGDLTCDAAKENKAITVNPLDERTLAGIYYTRTGEIHSSNDDIENDLDNTLNLNCMAASLPQRRQAALRELHRHIAKVYAGKGTSRSNLEKMLQKYESEQPVKAEYAGILIWWLKERLKR